MSVKLGNGLVVPDEAIILDMGSRGEQTGKVDFAVWCVPMIAYKGDAAVVLQVTQKPMTPPQLATGVILTRSMLQQMLVDIQMRPRC